MAETIPKLRLTRDASASRSSYRELRVALYDPLMRPLERALFAKLRAHQLRDVRGFGLEVGIGTGLSLRHYREDTEVIGVEPLHEMAMLLAARMPVAPLSHIVRANCERLPFADGSFDFVVGQFVCCSVAEPTCAVREMHRVLKPGGGLRLLEHVRSRVPVIARVQHVLAPAWSGFAFGCRLDGQMRPVLASSPFRHIGVSSMALGLLELISAEA
jgi:ubiquinone/menaquinone biosynthesis C-methylase UbiE